MSKHLELSLDVPVGLLARQISKDLPLPVVEKFKEGLRSQKKVNPRHFEEGIIKLHADDEIQAYYMGCYARTWLGSNSQLLLEFL